MFVFKDDKIYLLCAMDNSPNIQKIISLDLPELQPYRTLRRPLEHIKQRIFVAEGKKVVRRLLESNLTIVSMLMTPEWHEQLFQSESRTSVNGSSHSQSTGNRITIFIANKNLLESIVGFNLHQGTMAVAKVPQERSLDEVIQSIPKPHLLVALDGLVNAENVGVVVRNCAGFGVDGIIVGETSSSPYLRRAVRNSMGAVFKIPVVHCSNLVESLSTIKNQHNTKVVAAHLQEQFSIHSVDLSGNICIVLGNEGDGISKNVLQVCDMHVTIPMMNGTDSLNVGSASAVFLYEARKQRINSTR